MKRMNLLVSLIAMGLLSCSNANEEAPSISDTSSSSDAYTELVSKTTVLPSAYEQEASERGQVVRLDYVTRDSAYSETLLQIRGMAGLTETFTINNMTFHEKDGARHEYRPMMEYIYNALPFFFPNYSTDGIRHTSANASASRRIYNACGITLSKPQKGLNIINGQKTIIK